MQEKGIWLHHLSPFVFLVSSFCFWLVFLMCVDKPSSKVNVSESYSNTCKCVLERRNHKCEALQQGQIKQNKKVKFLIIFPQLCYIIKSSSENAGGRQNGVVTLENSFLQLTMHLPYDPAISHLHTRENKTWFAHRPAHECLQQLDS